MRGRLPPPRLLAAGGERLISIKVFSPDIRGNSVATKAEDEVLVQMEENQAALRDSIEQARELAEESDRLVRQHRGEAAAAPRSAS